jgi:hypothetical protein
LGCSQAIPVSRRGAREAFDADAVYGGLDTALAKAVTPVAEVQPAAL